MRKLAAILLFIAPFFVLQTRALTIVPTFDTSITSDTNAAVIENTINQIVQVYAASFNDSVTVNIKYHNVPTGFANSGWSYSILSYSSYITALKSHATTPYDAQAIALLPTTSTNPITGTSQINVQFANARALGLLGGPSPGQIDGDVYLNMSVMNLTRTNANPSKWDMMSVAMHETDEVLGFASALNGLTNNAPTPTGNIWPMDLFRYSATNGVRSFNTSSNTAAYFSLDGTNHLVRFNQLGGGDFSDWYGWVSGVVPQVQDSATVSGSQADLGIEKMALDAIGFTLNRSSLSPTITTTRSSQNVKLTWNSIPALDYIVQYTTSLNPTNWLTGASLIATNDTQSFTDPFNANPQRYFRVTLNP